MTTLTPMLQFIQDKVYTIIHNNGIPISQEISWRDTKYYYPISLSRVLIALGIEFYFWNGIRHAEKISNNYENRKYICDRKLLNSEGTDATLFDQSEETQRAIAILFGRKDE